MSMHALRRLALLAALLAGCGAEGMGTDAGTEPPMGSGATLQFVLKSGGDLGALPTQVGDLTVDSVTFWIERLELMGDRSDSYGREMVSNQPLDFTGGPVPFDLKDAAPALYSRLRVEFGVPDDHGGGIQGMGLSYRVSGKSGAGTPFVLSGHDDFQVDLRVVDGVELGAHTKVLCTVRFDMSAWFGGVALAGDMHHHSEGGSGGGDNNFLANVVRSASMTLTAVPR